MTQAFNLSQLGNFVNSSGQLNAAAGLYNQTPVANGGTGKATVTAGAILAGAGTANMVEIGGTTAGTILAASPTGWAATAASAVTGGNYILNAYTSPTTWTKPTGLKSIKVTVVGAGGNSGSATAGGVPVSPRTAGAGGGGGTAIRYIPAPSIPGPIAVTAGPGTNSFSTFASATAGASSSPVTFPAAPSASGAGGIGTNGTINLPGTYGSGTGGNSALFNGGGMPSSPSRNGTAYGGGAGSTTSTSTTTVPGSIGFSGIVIVEEYY